MLKIAITGPESTGKSTLSAQLASHYQTVWVPEYARTYIADLNREYTLADIEAIARGQLQLEQQLLCSAKNVLISDTDLLVLKIWSEHAFGRTPQFILDKLAQQDYNLYLLMGVDLPWEPDPQREHPHLRQYFYDWYKRELETIGVPFAEITGQQQERFINARYHIDALLQQHKL
ncbi:AAA family ATPase [Pontibacter fetidus]|uniref:ATP-binding protein n=1 Tax=Pontibacter fetidus TaxID=2700082 RepID=A0A6B2H5J4_9BACT|nr:ATP-binding protein [Pontibacter fetidus]NDK57723.1 ATP-binding protein [Pontibacter fetidus]